MRSYQVFMGMLLYLFFTSVISGTIHYGFLSQPGNFGGDFKALNKAKYQRKEWVGDILMPVLGKKKVLLPYFEYDLTADEMLKGKDEFALTLLKAFGDGRIVVAVITQKAPTQYMLADVAVSAFLPLWLMESPFSIDMRFVLASQDKEGLEHYSFEWRGRSWTFTQLNAYLSTMASVQYMTGGFMGKVAKELVCEDTMEISVADQPQYTMNDFARNETKCDLLKMNALAVEALQAFIKVAPKLAPTQPPKLPDAFLIKQN